MFLKQFLLTVSVLFSVSHCQSVPNQEYGYMDVRDGCHMFYWFYGANNTNFQRNDLPIVLWLQGGPGAGGSGYGNFGEMGPLDVNLQPRNTSWTTKVNLLFIDNPVGAGYSYVDDESYLTTDVEEIAMDLYTMHQMLTAKYSFMKTLPFWIFSESYGGKMTSVFAVKLMEALNNGDITINFQGVLLGDSWISGIDYVDTWPNYVYTLTLIDDMQLRTLNDVAEQCNEAMENNAFQNATDLWGYMEGVTSNATDGADWYNILYFDDPVATDDILRYNHLTKIEKYLSRKANIIDEKLGVVDDNAITKLMNGAVKQQLGIIPANVSWGGQSDLVFAYQEEDFMKDVISYVDEMLSYNIQVNVWNGQLDLICCTLGTLRWIESLTWEHATEWQQTTKQAVLRANDKSDVAYFKKSYRNFAMYFIMKAGHMVPSDNGEAALQALCDITGVPF